MTEISQLEMDLWELASFSYEGHGNENAAINKQEVLPCHSLSNGPICDSMIDLHHWGSNKQCTDCAGTTMNIKWLWARQLQPTVLQITIWYISFAALVMRQTDSTGNHLFMIPGVIAQGFF